ncbi:MAG: exodeoxyribonuclease VII small subunit [Lachnospiraceae bacterium]|nr:exodeoxyribonuclease VII small subunit [Lachnospiraceae bacterium]
MANEKNEMTLEESFEKLEGIISEMEADNTSLDKSFKLFMEGTNLLKECNDKIDRVEKAVMAVNENGSLEEFDSID